MYAWANPAFLLDEMTLEQVLLYYEKGWETRKSQAVVFWGVLGEALSGKDGEKNEKPDLQKFYETYGDKIKHPGK